MKRVFFRLPGIARARLAVLFALLAVCVYRSALYVPSPGIDQDLLARHFAASSGNAADSAAELFELYSSGKLGQQSEDAAR